MDSIVKQSLQPVQTVFSRHVNPMFNNVLVEVIISYVVIVAIIYSVEDLPSIVKDIFYHPIIKVAIAFIGIYSKTKKVSTAMMASLALVILFYGINYVAEKFTLIFPETDTYPGCIDVKVEDLLELFNGDRSKLKQSMYASGVPLDIELNDTNSPLIATYLINFGHKVTDSCKAPM